MGCDSPFSAAYYSEPEEPEVPDAVMLTKRHTPTFTDEQADAANIAWHQFVFPQEEPPTPRDLGATRQAWKAALAAAWEAGD